ncbi:uncharacterized protein LOC134468483 [Engraulis encrasicolus]|uniref:uncharacterized protein LOC134468483 n=1 Tax=Engraulis encrasicolus TaxID=184585 RepID=UPI002FD2F3E8
MDFQGLKDDLQADFEEMKNMIRQLLRETQALNRAACTSACHQMHPPLASPLPDGIPIMPCSAPLFRHTQDVLPPIGSAPKNQQQPQQPQQSGGLGTACSSSSMTSVIQDYPPLLNPCGLPKPVALRPIVRRDLTELDHAHPLEPLPPRSSHVVKSDGSNSTTSMVPAPPAVAQAMMGDGARQPKNIKARRYVNSVCGASQDNSCQSNAQYSTQSLETSEENTALSCYVSVSDCSGNSTSLSLVDFRTPSDQQGPSSFRTPIPPMPSSRLPQPSQAAKPQSRSRQSCSRLPRLKSSLHSVITAVEDLPEPVRVKSAAWRKEEVRESESVTNRKRAGEMKQAREIQQVMELPELRQLQSLSNPGRTLWQAFQFMSDKDWEKKVDGLLYIRCLSQNHAEVLLPRLHELCVAIIQEVTNRRSIVARAAMVTLAHLFADLGREMDLEAEATAQVLLKKVGDASAFIRHDAELALTHMVLNVTPSRSMTALLNTGLRHRNWAVRASAAQHLSKVAEIMGTSRILSGKKELTGCFIQAISCLALDPAQEVRTNARNTLTFLATNPNFIEMVDKFIPMKNKVAIKDIINKHQRK